MAQCKKKWYENCAIDMLLAFLFGLGLSEGLRHLSAWFQQAFWVDVMMLAVRLGLVGYFFWLGLKRLVELYRLEKEGVKVYTTALADPILLWLIGAATAAILFGKP